MISHRPRLVALAAALALIAAACVGPLAGKRGSYPVTVRFPSTFNLFEGSTVRVAGVDVGRVAAIDVPAGADTVRVTLAIEVSTRLPADVRAVIIPQALIGERYVQLDPPYTGGPALPPGAVIPSGRTVVPTDFDEVLSSLNDFLGALPEQEVARLVDNLAGVLEGRGEEVGVTLDNAEQAVDALRASDEELVRLASRLSDLNETLASRDEQLGAFVEDAHTLSAAVATNRRLIDEALGGVNRMTGELADLLITHRRNLEQDIGAVTRVGRTAVRNLDQIDRLLFWQAELFRHSERVIDRDKNWLPLVNNVEGLSEMIAERVADRLVGLCIRLGVEECSQPGFFDGQLPARICVAPVLPCDNAADPARTVPLGDALERTIERIPELEDRLGETGRHPADVVDELTGDLDTPAPSPRAPAGARELPSPGANVP